MLRQWARIRRAAGAGEWKQVRNVSVMNGGVLQIEVEPAEETAYLQKSDIVWLSSDVWVESVFSEMRPDDQRGRLL